MLPCGPGPAPDEFYIFTPPDISRIYSDKSGADNDPGTCANNAFPGTGTDSNINEWNLYFGLGSEDRADTEQFVYGENLKELKSALQELKAFGEKNGSRALSRAGKLSRNRAFVKAVRSYKIEALKYLLFAKECEKYANIEYDPWGPPPPDYTDEMMEMEKRGLLERNSAKDPSIQMRYAFQI